MRRDTGKRRRWGGAAVAVFALAAAILGLVVLQGGVEAQGTFDPVVNASVSDPTSGVNADVTTNFDVPATDHQYGQLVQFIPTEFYVAAADDVPIGAVVGTLFSQVTLGLIGGPCSSPMPVTITLLHCSNDTTDTISFDDQFADSNGNGIPDGCDHYPDYLVTLYPITPRARMYGDVVVAGLDVSLNFVVFESGQALAGVPSLGGYPNATVLNDPTAALEPSSITDFCAPLATDIETFGLSEDNPDTGENEAGYEVRRNPPYGGTYTFKWYGESIENADNDDYDNSLDTCPFKDNIDNSPKLDNGPDNDGIDSACDPDPAVFCWPGAPGSSMNGCDADGYINRGDNCPMVANGQSQDNQADADMDDIGDACDRPEEGTECENALDDEGDGWVNDGCPADGAAESGANCDNATDDDGDTVVNDGCPGYGDPNVPDGIVIEATLEVDVDIEGPPPGQDSDGDGFDDADERALGSCADDPCGDEFCSGTEAADSTPEDTSVAGTCDDGEDNDLDGYVDDVDGGCADDTDGDGASDQGEEDLGSDPEDADSTPEDSSVCDTCTDGVDNDGDGLTDSEDEGCAAVVATPTPTPEEGTPTPEATPTPVVEVEICAPVFPGTYNGRVLIDGMPAASGYEVTASIDDVQWGSAYVSGGRYAVDIPDHLPSEAPCFEGGTIVFELNGMTCEPSPEWASGLQTVDLSCAPAAPVETPTPSPTATPEATPTPTPSGPPPTGGGGLAGSSSALPLWAMILAGWVGLTTVAGLGALVAAKRRSV